jgi:cytochrome c oxidase subunit II
MDLNTAQNSNIFSFATEQGRTIVYLHYFDMAICLSILLIVSGLITYVAIKFRHRVGDAEPKQPTGNLKLEITWTLIPALILVVLGILTFVVMHRINPPVLGRQPDVVINAHQYWWEYRYPKSGVVTANELYLPDGVNSLIEVRSADVVHSFWVPDFGQKMDAIPGHPNHLYLTPIKKGLFTGSCSEFCGDDHALMRIVANVVSPKEFDTWIQSQQKIPTAAVDVESKTGEKVFMSKTCMECHSIAGTKATALVGPDLTHLASRQTIGSGLLANTTENVAKWIIDPQQFKPGCHMPKMRVTNEEAHAMAVYLENLK